MLNNNNALQLDTAQPLRDEINEICKPLSDKCYTDNKINEFFQTHFSAYKDEEDFELLKSLDMQFRVSSEENNYNRLAQANFARLFLLLFKKKYPDASAAASPSQPQPTSILGKISYVFRKILFFFSYSFGGLNQVIITQASVEHNFWQMLFPNASISTFIKLPTNLIFLLTTVINYCGFEGSYLRKSFGFSDSRDIDPALSSDHITITTTEKTIHEILKNRGTPSNPDFFQSFEEIMKNTSERILEKRKNYILYDGPPLWEKIFRWGLNFVGGVLVCCANAFSFKYTITAFSASIASLIPVVATFLVSPPVLITLTVCAVITALTFYVAKRLNTPNYRLDKFNHNAKKLNSLNHCCNNLKSLHSKENDLAKYSDSSQKMMLTKLLTFKKIREFDRSSLTQTGVFENDLTNTEETPRASESIISLGYEPDSDSSSDMDPFVDRMPSFTP